MKIIGIVGSIVGRKTLASVQATLEQIKVRSPDIEPELLDISQYQVVFAEGRDYRDYGGDTRVVIDKIMEADAYIIGTPTYQASISGVLKNLLDLLPVDGLRNKVVGIVTTAGSDKHFLMVEQQLKPLLSYMKAIIVPKYVFINEIHFIDNQIVDDEILYRIQQLADDTVDLMEVVEEFNRKKDEAYDF